MIDFRIKLNCFLIFLFKCASLLTHTHSLIHSPVLIGIWSLLLLLRWLLLLLLLSRHHSSLIGKRSSLLRLGNSCCAWHHLRLTYCSWWVHLARQRLHTLRNLLLTKDILLLLALHLLLLRNLLLSHH